MALINCPECNKEISDKVKACPNCGYPFETVPEPPTAQKVILKKIKKIKPKVIKRILIIAAAIVIIAILSKVAYEKITFPKKTYDEALFLLEIGAYDLAEEELDMIPNYDGVELLREQMFYESRACVCIADLKKYLKNPDSFYLYEVVFYKSNSENPICIFRYGAQNGFGGMTTGYAVFSSTDYTFVGSCNSLDINEIDDDELADQITCMIINDYMEANETVGSVDMERLQSLIKSKNCSEVTIVD